MTTSDETSIEGGGRAPAGWTLDPATPSEACARVWLYDRSAVSGLVLIASRLDRLAAAVAARGMVVVGRSSDTGSGRAPDGDWSG